ncbi:MAG: polysaccharide biosynthesis tyrosine autokinase [Acidobacteria bacterium]|nr:polysaccharide biosynthesis tyrosine autokinase [Acidobacteriota bacterium]
MEQDQRLTPLPKELEVRSAPADYLAGYPGFYDDEVTEGRRTVQQYLNVIYKRLPIILALTLFATIAAALYMYRQPSVFQSSAQMIIEPRKPKVQSKDSININFGMDVNYYNTQLQLLKSPDLMKDVVKTLGIYRDPNLLSGDRGVISGLRWIFSSEKRTTADGSTLAVLPEVASSSTVQTIQLSPDEEQRANVYAGVLVGGLDVEQQEDTNLVSVTVRSTNPELAARVANGVVELFKKQDAEREMSGAIRARDDLAKSIEDLRASIAGKESELMGAMASERMPLMEKGQELSFSRLQGLSETWMKSVDTLRQVEARYLAAQQSSARGEGLNLPDIYQNPVLQDTLRLNTERRAKLQDAIRDIEKQIKDAETEKAELLVKYTPEYFKVKQIEERIATLGKTKTQTEKDVTAIIDQAQQKIERDAVGGALTSLRSQVEAARRQAAQNLASYEQEAARANLQGQAETRLTTLKREIDTSRTLLDTYTQRQKEQELAIASEGPDNIKVGTKAIASTVPVGPPRGRNIFIAFLLSLFAGIGLAFLLDYLDDSVKSSEDIGRHLGLPTLALIPHYFGSEKRRLRLTASNGNGNGAPTGLIALEERHSPMSEAYRHLRTSLLFSSAGKPPQSILITSSQPSEGKTTTAINTAITLAQADADVVLVDCDLRRPRLHNYFEFENTQGLTNYLSGERNTEQLIKTCRDLPRLKVITSGPIPPNPAELLGSNEMKNLLQFLQGRYKHVIIDSPPAISFTDAAILSTLVDGVVLVAMAGKSSIHLMRRFKHRLSNLGARVYGVVLNGIKSGSIEYGYYGSSYYDYYSKGDSDTSTPLMSEVETTSRTNT